MSDLLVKDLKKDQEFWEFEYGSYVKCRALQDAWLENENYWRCDAEVIESSWGSQTGHVIEYGQSDECSCYGPKLYSYKAYRSQKDWEEYQASCKK